MSKPILTASTHKPDYILTIKGSGGEVKRRTAYAFKWSGGGKVYAAQADTTDGALEHEEAELVALREGLEEILDDIKRLKIPVHGTCIHIRSNLQNIIYWLNGESKEIKTHEDLRSNITQRLVNFVGQAIHVPENPKDSEIRACEDAIKAALKTP